MKLSKCDCEEGQDLVPPGSFLVLDLLLSGLCREVMLGCCDVLDVTLVQTAV